MPEYKEGGRAAGLEGFALSERFSKVTFPAGRRILSPRTGVCSVVANVASLGTSQLLAIKKFCLESELGDHLVSSHLRVGVEISSERKN